MGDQGTEACSAGDLILDAGALIALERGDSNAVALIWGALEYDFQVTVPATALAQVWRGGPRSASLARLIDAGEVDSLDEERAREVGVRLGQRDARDVADAHAVCCATESDASVVTSDPDDIRALCGSGEALTLIAV